jgi:peptidoglycan-N-acetylglucosamine deacetylase
LHLWGHSWEIEAHGLWPVLDRALAAAAAATPPERRLTNHALACPPFTPESTP